jgi:3-oxoacyl-[acyl-carrier protein] reductase
MDDLTGKVALVTGASRGIGRAVAVDLARHGCDVAVNFRAQQELADSVVGEIERMGRKAIAIKADIGDVDSCRSMVLETADSLGPPDIVVNNAGVWRGSRIEDFDESTLDWLMKTNVEGAFFVTRECVAAMKKRGWGRIVNMSSVIGVTGYPGDSMYGATKAALVGMVKSLARELARHGITANAIIPGFIQTDMNTEISDEARQRILETIPIRRWGTAEEVAALVSFLCEDGAYITGQLLTVDGGYTV